MLKRLALGVLVALAGAGLVAFEHGFDSSAVPGAVLATLQIMAAWFVLVTVRDVRWNAPPPARWASRIGMYSEAAVLTAVIAELMGYQFAAEALAIIVLLITLIRLNSQLSRCVSNPSLIFPASFVVLILVSSALLRLPASTPSGQPIGWVDAIFTATSAVCVTGLAVRDTASGFTPFGQFVILCSIQLGGLGVMIFGSTLALLFGARLSHRENMTLSMALSEYPAHRITRFVWFIVLTTLGLEAAGAILNFAFWPDLLAASPTDKAWKSVFHSVSAFCNAGFDITGDSLISLRATPVPYVAIIPMIVMGGFGFVALEDVSSWFFARLRRERSRLSTHTKIVLTTTAALLVGGAVVILVSQLKTPGTAPGQRVLDALFMSTTARTAGFTSVPMEGLNPGSRLMLMLLMLVGGSPGSTAGGIKTVVLAVLVISVVSTIRGRDEVEVFGRSLSDVVVRKAATIAFGMFAVIALTTLLLDLTEPSLGFEKLLFEVVSAATTTGLSLGVTHEITPVGRCILVGTMYLGRVGPLAVLAALVAGSQSSAAYRLPRDNVSLG